MEWTKVVDQAPPQDALIVVKMKDEYGDGFDYWLGTIYDGSFREKSSGCGCCSDTFFVENITEWALVN